MLWRLEESCIMHAWCIGVLYLTTSPNVSASQLTMAGQFQKLRWWRLEQHRALASPGLIIQEQNCLPEYEPHGFDFEIGQLCVLNCSCANFSLFHHRACKFSWRRNKIIKDRRFSPWRGQTWNRHTQDNSIERNVRCPRHEDRLVQKEQITQPAALLGQVKMVDDIRDISSANVRKRPVCTLCSGYDSWE